MTVAAFPVMAIATTNQLTRDIIVVGASAGGVDALPRLLGQLPRNFPASVFVVQHLAPTRDPQLASILRRACVLPVDWAEQGARIERGRVYVAPPDVHMVFENSHIRLARGPRENYARPSICRLFRSAAATHAGRTIAILMTGMMDDGVGGALAIQQAGGRVIVQDPIDAAFPELPMRALQTFSPDATLRLGDIGNALIEMTKEVVPRTGPPREILLEHDIDERGTANPRELDRIGKQSSLACAECGGPTWQIGDQRIRRYRCYLGHVQTGRAMLEHSSEELEAALWSAVRALHERAATLETLARDAGDLGGNRVVDDYAARAKEAHDQAELARKFMLDLLRNRH